MTIHQTFVVDGTSSFGTTSFYSNVALRDDNTTASFSLPSGVVGSIQVGERNSKSKGDTEISPGLYMKYVKSKMTTVETNRLKASIKKLAVMLKQTELLGQHALYESLAQTLALHTRSLEVLAVLPDTCVVKKTDIEKFKNKVQDKVVKFLPLEEFPRTIPPIYREKIMHVKETKIFDELWILFIDYKKENIKTNKQKIKEKDPIVFGKFAYDSENLFWVCDWIDEYCDLTLEKFIETVKKEDIGYRPDKIEPVSDKFLEAIKKDVLTRHERLKSTNSSNFRSLMVEEDKSKNKSIVYMFVSKIKLFFTRWFK